MAGNEPVFVSLGSKAAYGYDPMTGKELWRIEERDAASRRAPGRSPGNGLVYLPDRVRTPARCSR